jgi:hypothetical protein
MSFCESICDHLSNYKVEVLGVKENGIFRYRGRDVPKAHILPFAGKGTRGELNILPYREVRFFEQAYSPVKRHQFFHHLNSSQALCFNLFYPLLEECRLLLITEFLRVTTTGRLDATFERQSRIEKAERRTSFDFHLGWPTDNNIFFEVKYTEEGFGKAKADAEHSQKFREMYSHLVDCSSEFLSRSCQDEAFFLAHYQILRNFVHLDSSSYVVFLLPSANDKVRVQAFDAMEEALTAAGKERVKVVFLEDLIAFLEGCQPHSLAAYYREFRRKYVPEWSVRPDQQGGAMGGSRVAQIQTGRQ